MNKKVFVICLVAVAVIAAVFLLNQPQASAEFAEDVDVCNKVDSNLRFSCYSASIQKHYDKDVDKLLADIKKDEKLNFKSEDQSYAVFGTNCHTFYHSVGDFIATISTEDFAAQISKAPLTCTAAAIMGLYKRTALKDDFSEDVLKSMWTLCPKGAEHQCTHEVGHLLHDKYVSPVLEVIDGLSKEHYDLNLADYQYKTALTANLDQPFEDCKKLVPPAELPYCYTGVGHNLYLYAEFSPDGVGPMFAACDKTDESHRADCYDFLVYRIGINDAATKFLASDFTLGNKICNDVMVQGKQAELKKHCYLGIGGGIGLFVDSEYANLKIDESNLASVQKAVLSFINMCEQSEAEFKAECYKGLLGTRVKKLYKDLNLDNIIIEEILPQIQSDFEVVG
jgi:hypothetical protein